VERAVVAVDTALAAHTSLEATATPGGDDVRAPAEEVHDTTSTSGPTGGDTDERAHLAELEALLLTVSSPAREALPEDAGVAQTNSPPAIAEAEV
jgi:methylglyoxal synthase